MSTAVPTLPPDRRVLLIGWDAADWQVIHPLLDAGQMPHLRRLIEGGAMGNLHSLQPMLSPILWTSIATGKRAFDHGVHGFVEPLPDRSGIRPVGTLTRRCPALWNLVTRAGGRSVVCGWQASHPAEPIAGAFVSNAFTVPSARSTPDRWPVAPEAVHPPALAAELADLRVHPAEVGPAWLVSFVPRLAELDAREPGVRARLGVLAARLAEVIGAHAIATELLAREDWNLGAVYYECIDQVGHDFMPFHPPCLPEVPAREFELYQEVMSGIYRFHDQMLGVLVELAGPAAHVMVVSDHGFESGSRRPRGPVEPARWHRAQGIFVLGGPHAQVDATVEGASLLDVAPTVLALLGLPAGADMPGRVLVGALEPSLAAETPGRIPSWEDLPGADGRRRPGEPGGETDPAVAQALLQQFIDLGYVDAPGEDVRRAVAQAEAEADYNVAASLGEAGRAGEAKTLLVALTDRFPDEVRYWLALARMCFASNAPEDAAACLAALERLKPAEVSTIVIRGLLAWSRGDLDTCAAALSEAEAAAPNDALVQTYLGRLHLRRRRWRDAESAFRRALALDPDLAEAHYGLSVALPRQDRVEAGIEHGLRAVGLRHEFPEAHFQLGAILSRLGWYERALQAFDITLRLRPGFVLAHRYLARINARLGRLETASRHRQETARLLKARVSQPPVD